MNFLLLSVVIKIFILLLYQNVLINIVRLFKKIYSKYQRLSTLEHMMLVNRNQNYVTEAPILKALTLKACSDLSKNKFCASLLSLQILRKHFVTIHETFSNTLAHVTVPGRSWIPFIENFTTHIILWWTPFLPFP